MSQEPKRKKAKHKTQNEVREDLTVKNYLIPEDDNSGPEILSTSEVEMPSKIDSSDGIIIDDFIEDKCALDDALTLPDGPQHFEEMMDGFDSSSIDPGADTMDEGLMVVKNVVDPNEGTMSDEDLSILEDQAQIKTEKNLPVLTNSNNPVVSHPEAQTMLESKDRLQSATSSQSSAKKIKTTNLEEASNIKAFQKRRYQHQGKLGSGGMGQVFSVLDLNLRREVAVKVTSSKLSNSEDQIHRFLAEAQITSQLEHPNIIPVHELGSDRKGQVFFSMKKVEGIPLSTIIKGLMTQDVQICKEYTHNHLLRCFRKICDAVAFAHSQKVIHRDLKPDNIMVGKFGEILVMDWGLAKVLEQDKETTSPLPSQVNTFRLEKGDMTMEGAVTGTPLYMSPEQAEGKVSEIREGSDIYSLGAILFELFAHVPPVSGDSLKDILINVIRGELIDMSPFEKNIPKEILSIIKKCLSVKPKERYASVELLCKDIDHYLDELPVSTYPGNVFYRAKKFIRRHPTMVGVLATVALFSTLLIASGTYFFYKNAQLAEERKKAIESEFETQSRLMVLIEKEKQAAQKRANSYKPFIHAVELIRRQENPQDILAKLNETLKENEDFYPAIFEKATWCKNNGQSEEAIKLFRQAYDIYRKENKNQPDLKSLFNLALVYLYNLEDKEKGIATFQEISKLKNLKSPYYLMAEAYLNVFSGDFEEAFKLGLQAHEVEETLWEVHATFAEISSLGTDHRADFCRLNEIVPENTKKDAQQRKGDWSMIPLMCWSRAIQLNPNLSDAYINRALVFEAVAKENFEKKKISEGKAALKKAKKDYQQAIKRNHPKGFLQLTMLHLTENNVAKAEKVLSQFKTSKTPLKAEAARLFQEIEKRRKKEQESILLKIEVESIQKRTIQLKTNLPENTVLSFFWIANGAKFSENFYVLVQRGKLSLTLPQEIPSPANLWFRISMKPEEQSAVVLEEFNNPLFSWKKFGQQQEGSYFLKLTIKH